MSALKYLRVVVSALQHGKEEPIGAVGVQRQLCVVQQSVSVEPTADRLLIPLEQQDPRHQQSQRHEDREPRRGWSMVHQPSSARGPSTKSERLLFDRAGRRLTPEHPAAYPPGWARTARRSRRRGRGGTHSGSRGPKALRGRAISKPSYPPRRPGAGRAGRRHRGDDDRAAADAAARRAHRRQPRHRRGAAAGRALRRRDALELATFPTLLLLTTLFRLALECLGHAADPAAANAGAVIHAFGEFVVRGDLCGRRRGLPDPHRSCSSWSSPRAPSASPKSRRASRSTPCPASRWPSTPTCAPGHRRRRSAHAAAARSRAKRSFYGAMDGAMKFVKGDAIAGMHHPRHQHRRRPGHRRRAARHAARRRARSVHAAHHRRRPGLADPGAAHLDGGRPRGHARRAEDDEDGATLGPIWRASSCVRAPSPPAVLLALLALVPGLPLWPFLAAAGGAGVAGAAPPAGAPARAGRRSAPARARRALEVALDPRSPPRPSLESRLVPSRARSPTSSASRSAAGSPSTPGCRCAATRSACAAFRSPTARPPTAASSSTSRRASCRPGVEGQRPNRPVRRARRRRGCRRRRWRGCRRPASSARRPVGNRGAPRQRAALGAPELVGLDETQRPLARLAREHPALVRALVPARADSPLVADVLRRLVAEASAARPADVLEALARAADGTTRPRRRHRARAHGPSPIDHTLTPAMTASSPSSPSIR